MGIGFLFVARKTKRRFRVLCCLLVLGLCVASQNLCESVTRVHVVSFNVKLKRYIEANTSFSPL